MDELEKKYFETEDPRWIEEYKKFIDDHSRKAAPPGTIIKVPKVPGTFIPYTTVRKRGRPKGSKSKPKIVTAKLEHENWEFTFSIPVKILMETPVNVLENLRDEKDVSRKLRILATILEGKV